MSSPEMKLDDLIKRYPILNNIKKDIQKSFNILKNCYLNNGKLLIAGNGGSAADAEHIVGELMKGFVKKRPIDKKLSSKLIEIDPILGEKLSEDLQCGLPTIALTTNTALNTAFSNDVNGDFCFAQQLNGYGKEGDIFLGISTSGNSKNILYAAIVAKAKGIITIGLSGKDGGKLKELSDINIIAPESETYKIQELHLPIYHTLCLMLEEFFYEK